MKTWVVIPIKGVARAKTRLSAVLSQERRARLVATMLATVVDAVRGAAPDAVVTLVGPSRHGIDPAIALLPDGQSGLNMALAIGRDAALADGAERILFLPADLARIGSNDVRALLATAPSRAVIAPDHALTGTNALLLPAALAVDFVLQYGEDSFAAHSREAARLGTALTVVTRPGLQLDIDTPEDLILLERPGQQEPQL
ncbi:2-phospho-L-lactate guanylyltransferase [Sphingobium sp. JS3065]|uniref:2-phospho-L-lactate guanylyltransferase n=1 Tax=Sphingobium sp. JS3065 TaxID=2970925 RepID=UPI0022652A73|nr:2-phospho-L-lactate guanylyltransferase [Sphingobium sp. JS3065]UZW55422.1 2-phospho-L-lactate guanylyltransferase [Sphingobium sp. JS3065]